MATVCFTRDLWILHYLPHGNVVTSFFNANCQTSHNPFRDSVDTHLQELFVYIQLLLFLPSLQGRTSVHVCVMTYTFKNTQNPFLKAYALDVCEKQWLWTKLNEHVKNKMHIVMQHELNTEVKKWCHWGTLYKHSNALLYICISTQDFSQCRLLHTQKSSYSCKCSLWNVLLSKVSA